MSRDPSVFQPIPNPYIVGNPVEDSRMFFGREVDFEYIRTKFESADQGAMIVLCGTRRSGKTSILFQIKQGRLGAGFLPVLVDMQASTPENDSEFVRELAARIGDAIGEAAGSVRFAPEGDGFTSLRDAFLTYCRDLYSVLGNRSLAVLFDEYELFETHIDEGRLTIRVLDLLGEAIRGKHGLFVVFAGSEKLEDRKAEYWSSSVGKALFQRISFLREKDALRLVHDPVAGQVEYAEGVPERILALGARQPFYTQALCQGLVDRLNERRSRRAELEDIEAVAHEIVENPLPHMIFTWGAFTDPEKIVVACFGELNREGAQERTAAEILEFLKTARTGVTLAEDVLNEALESLFQDDILTKDEAGEYYDLRMDVWRLWVARMHSIWQALDEIFAPDRKPDPDVIRIARRRLKRIAMGLLLFVLVGTPAVLIAWFQRPPDPIPVAPPDSSFFAATTKPPGARVFLDNYLLGTSPLDSVRVPAGRFQYRCELAGFATVTDSITLVKEELASITAELPERIGNLRIESEPPGATVSLDGELLEERTPLTLDGLSGRKLYTARLSLGGFLSHTYENIQIAPDSTVSVSHRFSRRRHPLTIGTDPRGATVIFDGRELGKSPRTLSGVDEGDHRLEVRLYGYFPREESVEIPVPGNRVDLTLDRHPPGRLQLTSLPYADIFVGGERVATNSMSHELELYEGEYEIEFRHKDFPARSYRVVVGPDSTSTVANNFLESR